MNNIPETSVIVGAYNVCNCFSFEKSMQSILNQSYKDFELIICDDGSTDKTWEILQHYAQTDSRIKLLRNNRNIGLAATLNKCLEASSGQIIARHDCDDYCTADRLDKQVNYLKLHKDIGVLGCNAYLFDERGVWGKETFPSVVTNRDFLFNSPYKHGSVVFRKEALLKVGGYRVAKETYRTEDYDLFMTLQEFTKGENLQEYLYFFCEDKNARKRRRYRYRINEARVRYRGFKKLNLLPKGFPYVIKPLIVGLIPAPLLDAIKNSFYDRKINSFDTLN